MSTFIAKYDGVCAECGSFIRKGDELIFVDKSVVHASCEPDATKFEVDRPTCPRCWQLVSVSGACGCDPE